MPGRPVIAAAETLPAPLPGWYGKLPGLGDFAARRLDKAMVGVWDGWLQDGLQALRQQPGWLDAYLQSPVWCFALGAGVLGPQRWLGVMMPSVDAVGRYFPLAIFFEGGVADLLQKSELNARMYWAWGARAALHALEHDLDATGLDAHLQSSLPGPEAVVSASVPDLDHWPQPGHSLWMSLRQDGGVLELPSEGLPRGVLFNDLWRTGSGALASDIGAA